MEGWGYVEGRLHPSGDLRGAWLGKRLCLEFLGMLDDSWSEPRLSVGRGAGGGGGRGEGGAVLPGTIGSS